MEMTRQLVSNPASPDALQGLCKPTAAADPGPKQPLVSLAYSGSPALRKPSKKCLSSRGYLKETSRRALEMV
jgi:hypothetical protein